MAEQRPEDELQNEFARLGQNLQAAARSAWESEESRKLQAELRSGLAALEVGLREAAGEARRGETGQRLKAEVEELGERLQSGEVERQLRQDLLEALRKVNGQLQKWAQAPRADDPE